MNAASRIIAACFAISLLDSCGLDEATQRSDKPLSSAAPLKDLPMAPPLNATNIYYLFHAEGLQTLMFYLRYNVPPDSLDQSIAEMIAHNEKRYLRAFKISTVPISAAQHCNPEHQFMPVPWWDTRGIKSGDYRNDTEAVGVLQIWVDRAYGTVFVHMTD